MRATVNYILLSGFVLLLCGWNYASAGVFEGYPDLFVCELGGNTESAGSVVFYVDGRDSAGVVYYRAIYRQLTLQVDKDGVVQPKVSGPNSCIGKSLKELDELQKTRHYGSS